jgi:site-specific DNA-methyltransferase (adenine-specific)
VWFVPYPTIRLRVKDRPHPASFPADLADMCLKLHGLDRARRVLDPFMGLGSVGVAARRHKIPFVGFDIDPAYVAAAEQELQRMNDQ